MPPDALLQQYSLSSAYTEISMFEKGATGIADSLTDEQEHEMLHDELLGAALTGLASLP